MVPRDLQQEVYATVDQRGTNIDASWAPWWRAQAYAGAAVMRALGRHPLKVDEWLQKELEVAEKLEARA